MIWIDIYYESDMFYRPNVRKRRLLEKKMSSISAVRFENDFSNDLKFNETKKSSFSAFK